jgi:RNA binding protein fox-1
LKSHFTNRVLAYRKNLELKTTVVTGGVPQGSILGPSLWNAMYDGVLTLELPAGVEIVGFADDIVMMVTGESLEEVEVLATEAIRRVARWLQNAKLQIAHHKTEILLVSNRRAIQHAEITVEELTITSRRELKYLGVMIDDRLNFNSHVDYACEKAAKAISALSRIMPNNAGPISSKRRLLASVSSSILRYGGPAWITALQTQRNRAKLRSTARLMAIRVVSAYRTISSEAVCVIAGIFPIDITIGGRYPQVDEGRIDG